MTLVFGGIFSTTTSVVAPEPPQEIVEVQQPVSSKDLVKQRIEHYASFYNVSPITMNIVVDCESQYYSQAVGDNGTSFGLVQIHAPAHPNVTLEQAFDIEFALNFLAKNLKDGKGSMWTCWRMHR